jgi:hypothetical protein
MQNEAIPASSDAQNNGVFGWGINSILICMHHLEGNHFSGATL